MSRVADDILSTHVEVALATAPLSLLDGLDDSDRRRRHMAIGEIARHVTERLRCFDIQCDEIPARQMQAGLFPDDIGPMSSERRSDLYD